MEGTLWGGPMTGVGHSALPRARHMDPKASSTRDSPPVACLAVRSDDLRGAGVSGRRGPEGRFSSDARFLLGIVRALLYKHSIRELHS